MWFVYLMKMHEHWRDQDEQNVGNCVEELGDEGRERVVLLAPVDRGAPAAQMRNPHFGFFFQKLNLTLV